MNSKQTLLTNQTDILVVAAKGYSRNLWSLSFPGELLLLLLANPWEVPNTYLSASDSKSLFFK